MQKCLCEKLAECLLNRPNKSPPKGLAQLRTRSLSVLCEYI